MNEQPIDDALYQATLRNIEFLEKATERERLEILAALMACFEVPAEKENLNANS